MEIDLEKFKGIEAYLTEVQGGLTGHMSHAYGRLGGAIGPLRAIIRDEEARIAHEEQKAQDEAELLQFVQDASAHDEETARAALATNRDLWVERKRKVYRTAQVKVLKQQGYDVMSHNEMDGNCDYLSHDGTRYSGMDWYEWPMLKDEKFPMKMLRNYSTHPVKYVDGVDING
jgi:hypothetical protein